MKFWRFEWSDAGTKAHGVSPDQEPPTNEFPIRKFKEVDCKRLLNEEEWYVIILFVYKT